MDGTDQVVILGHWGRFPLYKDKDTKIVVFVSIHILGLFYKSLAHMRTTVSLEFSLTKYSSTLLYKEAFASHSVLGS